jgi:hypothetical protein
MIICRLTGNNVPDVKRESKLMLWKVPPGTGTTGKNWNYCYRFSPILPIDGGGSLEVSLHVEDACLEGYVIHSYASSSPGIILSPGQPSLPFPLDPGLKSISFDLELRPNELVFLSVIVIDPCEPDDLICCDPQVANDART